MKKFILSMLLVCLLPLAALGHPYFTNEPPGSTPITSCAFNDSTFCNAIQNTIALSRWYNLYPSAETAFATDASEPASPNGAVDFILDYYGTCNNGGVSALDCAVGGGQIGYIDNKVDRELFVGFTFLVPSGYGCNIVGSSKVLLTRTLDNLLGFMRTNGVFNIRGCGTTKQFVWSHNSSNNDNSHACSLDLGLICFPNLGSGNIVEGTWAKVETCIRSSTTNTARDGVVTWHIDGSPAGRYTNINYGNGNINEAVFNQTMDGWGNGQGFTQTVRQRIGDVYMSAPPPGGCAGAPIVTDTIAPTQVTGVTITSVASSTIGLSWNPSNDNVGIAGYNVEMCTGQACTTYAAKQGTTGTGTTVVITGLSPATPYSFRLKARDGAGNVSAQYSTPVTATTSSPGSGTVTRNTLATDNFNRADNTDLGSDWDGDYYATGATAPLQIVGNKVRAGVASTKESNETYNAVALPSDQWAQVTLSTWAADATERYAWVNLRAGAPQTPSYYQCQAARNEPSGYTTLIERENGLGVSTYLLQSTAVTWAAGDTLSCEAIGVNPTVINVYRNGALIASVTDNASLTNLRTGAGIWTVGLTTVEIDDFLAGDFTGVTLPTVSSAVTDSTGANITWTGGPVSIRVNYDGGQVIVPVGSLPGGRFSFLWPADTTFACFFAVDAQGNVNTITSDYVCDTVVPSTTDITSPTVSSPLPSGTLAAGTTSTTISVVTSEPAVCKYATSAGVSYASMANAFVTPVSSTQHSATVSSLVNNTTYTYYVKCADAIGNITPADTVLTFSVNAAATDVIAPTAPSGLSASVLNANQVQLTFSPSTDAVGVAGYQVFACITASCLTYELVANGGGSPILVSGLQPNTGYSFKVRGFDAVQNLSTFSNIVEVTTPILDTVAPSRLMNLVATRTGYDSFNLSWDPGTDDNMVAGAAIEICVGDGCDVFKLQYIVTGRTSITISGLASQLPYYFRGKHIDSAGNVSEEYSELAKGEPFPLQSGTIQGVCACQIP